MRLISTLRNTFIFCIISTSILTGCTRITSTELGGGLIPPIDGVFTKDTILDVITDTYYDQDTTRIYKGDVHVLGAITNDPIFGRTSASMFFEMAPSYYPFFISGNKDSVKVDSAVLILGYNGFYGDSTQPLRLTVSEINQSTRLNRDRLYPANYPNVTPVSIGAPMGSPVNVDIRRLNDTIRNRFEVSTRQIRIPLRADIAQRFIKNYDSTNAYKNDSIFRTYFAGFALTTDQNAPANALLRISLSDTNTKFALYYSTSSTGATTRDTSVQYFRFNTTSGGDANFVTRNRAGSQVANYVTTNNNPKSDSLVYVQAAPGVNVRVRIPGLATLSNRIIHRAELIAEQVPDDANLLTIDQQMSAPRYLLLSVLDSVRNSKRNVRNDYIFSTDGPNITDFGGFAFYKTTQGYNRVTAYTFNLSRYIQGIISRKDSSHLLQLSAPTNDSIYYTNPYPNPNTQLLYYLNPSIGNDVANGRVRLGGGTHSRFRMRLRIIFSRI
ncbi:DUF4270 family protein [Sediminibacterium goheungense]|uniref:Uncharacterized protein DUF4270 n=1 Tax=Sediminibacterium goheungense TaxID=1086393 RepID=A0A4R6IZJ2_9BACT|nr:DUF4270 family protein [Sediminibacterium goheungense]TDO28319.1 uncharacterized protein DUF4270 [Sediminibacterium goheungense]